MNLSELIAKHGDDKVRFQRLDDCAEQMDKTRHGTRVVFVTPENIGLDGFDKLGLVVWLDREIVARVIAGSRKETAEHAPKEPPHE